MRGVTSHRLVGFGFVAIVLSVLNAGSGSIASNQLDSIIQTADALATPRSSIQLGLLGLVGSGGKKDLERLIEQIELVEAGEQNVDFSTARTDELGRLSNAIDRMVSTLRERKRQHATLIRNIPGMVYRCRNRPGRSMEFVSAGCLELTGYDPVALESGEVVWGEDVVLDNSDEIWNAVHRHVSEDESFRLTYAIETADGESRWVEEQGRAVPTDNGSVEVLEGIIIDVTERFEHERQLERNSYMLEQSQRIADVGGWELDVSTTPYELTWTDQTYHMTGVEPGTPVDLDDALEHFHPDDRPEVRNAIERGIEIGESYDHEVRGVRSGGEKLWLRSIGEPVVHDGDVVKIHGVTQDITDSKERERELERTRHLLAQSQRLASVGAWELDLTDDPYSLMWTDEVYRLTGIAPDEPIDLEGALACYHPEDRPRLEAAIEHAIDTGEGYDLELRMLSPNGDQRWVRTIGETVRDDDETTILRGSIQDVTDRKERERELERKTDFLQHIERIANVGGWETTVSAPSYADGLWTDGLFDIFEMAPRSFTLEELLEYVHPVDREYYRNGIERAFESRQSFSMEYRVITANDNVRWLSTSGEPVDDGEEIFRGASRDITEFKEFEFALESLHEATRELLQMRTEAEVTGLVVETALAVLAVDGVGLYRLDGETNRLESVASTAEFDDRSGGDASISVSDTDSVIQNAYVTGSRVVTDEETLFDRSAVTATAHGALVVPVGDYGVFVVIGQGPTVDERTTRLVEILVATTAAALDRLDQETELQKRDVELEERNRQLHRQVELIEIIRSVDQSLVGATNRAEIERSVCQRLAASEDVAFAWIGELNAAGSKLVPRAWDGVGRSYLDTVSLRTNDVTVEPAVRTALERESTVVSNIVDQVTVEEWRSHAIASGFESSLSVPLAFDEYGFGVLTVYATEPGAFGELELTVFEDLGVNIANAINGARTMQALHADSALELTLRFDDSTAFLARVATDADCTVEYEGLATHSSGESRVFFTARDGDSDRVEHVLEEMASVADYRLISRSADACLFEVAVSAEVLAARLLRHGGKPRSIRAIGSQFDAVVRISTATDVREFVEMLNERYSSVELLSRREVGSPLQTREELISSLLEGLTDRQLEVLRTAYLAGFFEWPRESTGEDIAEMLGVAQPTVNRHIRVSERRLFDQLFGSEKQASLSRD